MIDGGGGAVTGANNVLRAAVAFAVAITATALSLLSVVWMSRAAPDASRSTAPTIVAYEMALPPPTEIPEAVTEPEPAAEISPSSQDSLPSPLPASPSELPAGPALSGPSTAAMGGLPMLGSGLVVPKGAPPPGAADVGDRGPDVPAKPISRPQPRYPRAAQQGGIEGSVTVRLRVDERGRVDDVVVVRGDPPGVFDDVAVQTAKTYRFRPALRGGRAVATTVQQRIVFRLGR